MSFQPILNRGIRAESKKMAPEKGPFDYLTLRQTEIRQKLPAVFHTHVCCPRLVNIAAAQVVSTRVNGEVFAHIELTA
jgi:hypothetical protein